MTEIRSGRWGAFFREAFAVLAAILVAFALDAWWDERVEQREMLAALEAVSIEVRENIQLADSIIQWNLEIFEVNNRLAQMTPATMAALSDRFTFL